MVTQHAKTPLEPEKMTDFLLSHQTRLEETYMRLMQMAPDAAFTNAMDNVRRGKQQSALDTEERSEGPAKKRKLNEAW